MEAKEIGSKLKMHIPIDSPDIRSVYLMDRSGKGARRFNKERSPRIERIKAKVIRYWREKKSNETEQREAV